MARCFFILLIIFVFFGCKKEKDSSVNTQQTSNPNPNNPISTNGTGTTTYDALLEINKVSSKVGGNFTTPVTNCRAFFCAQTVTNEVYLNYQNLGTVSLNSVVFSNNYFNQLYYYTDSTYTNFVAPFVWNISGGANFTAATFTNSTVFPSFTNYISLPDSISKSAGFQISLSGANNCDFIRLTLIGPSGSQYLSPKIAAGNSVSVGYSSSELTSINLGNNGLLQIEFFNDNAATVNGKKVNIRSGTSYSIFSLKVY